MKDDCIWLQCPRQTRGEHKESRAEPALRMPQTGEAETRSVTTETREHRLAMTQ